MKNYEEMAQSVLKRRDIEIKRRRRAFIIGAPCAAAFIIGAAGVSAAAVSRGSYRNINLTSTVTDHGNNAAGSLIGFSISGHSDGTGKDNVEYATIGEPAPAEPAYSYCTGSDTGGTNAIGNDEYSDYPPFSQDTAIDLPVSTVESSEICIGVPLAPDVPPVPNVSAPESVPSTVDFPTSTAEIVAVEPPVWDFTNPNAGQNDIKILDIDGFNFNEIAVVLDENDFNEYTLEELDRFYGLRFNRLGELYPWSVSYDKLGVYRHEENDGFIASMKIVSSLNTITYTAADKTVTVSAQYGEFSRVSSERLSRYKPTDIPKTEVHTEYDENGNVIGQSVGAYAPSAVITLPDEGASVVNGYEALIYRNSNGDFLADLDMSSCVRITASGLSEEEFLDVLDNFTK